jgi:UDP-arabinose 4-epimerase
VTNRRANTSSARDVVLVTGGAGYIGAHACKALSAAGFLPVTYDSLIYGHEWAVKWGPLERGDILDRACLDATIAKHEPAAIMHFAAHAYVGESVTDPGKYFRNNVAGSLNLLEAARDHKISRFVFSSTCATYGIPGSLPIRETTEQRPINPYGASKLMVERMLADFSVAHPLRFAALRYFNAAGADPDGEIGEDHTPETHLIPLVLDAAAGVRPSVQIYGDDYATPDGTCVRDYIHVSDLADAHVKALQNLETDPQDRHFNLGTGHGHSVRQLIHAAEKTTGRKVNVVVGPRRAGDPPELVADPALAGQRLRWRATRSGLDHLMTTAWKWHRRAAQERG